MTCPIGENEMTERKDYTLRVIKFDKRCKSGELKGKDYDYKDKTEADMNAEIADLSARLYPTKKYRLELHETYVTKTNFMTGLPFQERFDTPYYGSPSSETYWSR